MKSVDELRKLKLEKDNFYKTISDVKLPWPYDNKKIFIGGCKERGVGSSFRHQAHAHNYTNDLLFGWICFRSIKRIGKYNIIQNDDGTCDIIITKLSQTILHEIAHILTPNHGHDKKWLDKYIEIGASKGQIKHYQKRYKGCN